MPVPHSEDLRVFHFHIAPFSSSPSHTQWVTSSCFDFHISALWLGNTTINISVWPENWFVFGMYGFEMVCSRFCYFVGPSWPWSLRKIIIVIKINIGLRYKNYFEAVKTSILIQNIHMYRGDGMNWDTCVLCHTLPGSNIHIFHNCQPWFCGDPNWLSSDLLIHGNTSLLPLLSTWAYFDYTCSLGFSAAHESGCGQAVLCFWCPSSWIALLKCVSPGCLVKI